jgi:hypothetical protein
MTRVLRVADGSARLVSTTTTVKLAQRMLAAANVVHNALPHGFATPTPINILLELYLAEERGLYPLATELSDRHNTRWVAALASVGLVDYEGSHVALTDTGYETVIATLTELFNVQRALD